MLCKKFWPHNKKEDGVSVHYLNLYESTVAATYRSTVAGALTLGILFPARNIEALNICSRSMSLAAFIVDMIGI